MSKYHDHWVTQWRAVSDSLPGTFTWNGTPLTSRDANTWKEALLLWAILCEDLDTGYLQIHRIVLKWIRYVSTLDTFSVGSCLKKYDKLLINLVEQDDYQTSLNLIHSFKQNVLEETGVDERIILPIARLFNSFAIRKEVNQFRACHQFLSFISRVSFIDIPEDKVVEDFINDDRNLRPPHDELVRSISRIIGEWFRGFKVEDVPSHGPGSTADAGRGSLWRKYKHLGTDQLLSYVLRRHEYDFDHIGNFAFERIAKLQCVPKTMLTKRTICMEPATLQFYQQMVRKSVYRWMEIHPYLRRVIKLDDQTQNRQFAYEGSLTGLIATIDLSKASDSVSWDLARIAFSKTSLLPWLYATRSRAVSVSKDETIAVKKFAPMGSALCFPIECIIFAAICELAKRDLRDKCCDVTYSIYGDDIAITTDVVPVVIDYLEKLGFTVNRDKSFYNENVFCYRESCGAEYLSGIDVAPLKISRGFSSGPIGRYHPGRVENLIQFANACWTKGFLGCRRWIIHRLQSLPRDLLPAFGEEENKLHSYTYTNWKNQRRYNKHLQLVEVRSGCTSCRCQPCSDEAVRLLHYQLCSLQRQIDAKRQSDSSTLITEVINTDIGTLCSPRLVSRWTR